MKIRLIHEYAATADEFWDAFFDEMHQDEMYQRMKAKRKLLSYRRSAGGIEMSQMVSPERELPLVLRKLTRGGSLGYTEHWSFDRSAHVMVVQITPSVFAERVHIDGRYFTEYSPAGSLVRVFEGELKIQIPLFGGALERIVLSDMTSSFGIAAQVTGEWIERRRQAAG